MATRRRRTSTQTPKSQGESPTLDEMLEIAEEREAEVETLEAAIAESEGEEIQELMDVALHDTFEAIQQAEEEKGVADFFDPSFYQPRPPAPTVPGRVLNLPRDEASTRTRKIAKPYKRG